MNTLFKRLPLLTKLLLIGLVPLVFLVYTTIQLYRAKALEVKEIESYQDRINQAGDIMDLINNLQDERKFSFDYAMTGTMREELLAQRPRTDSLINKLKQSKDKNLEGFETYTKLYLLHDTRNKIDSGLADQNAVMHFYSNNIFRMNTLNTVPVESSGFLKTVHSDLVSQKLLSEILTYLGIIRSNIYNVLYTKKYMIETMMGTVGTHDVMNSYEQEFLLKASPEVAERYKTIRTTTQLKPTLDYMDTLFKRFAFDSTYNAARWWWISDQGVWELKVLQHQIRNQVNAKVQDILNDKKRSLNTSIIFLAVAIILVIMIVAYTVHIISRMLNELKIAADKMSKGIPGVKVSVRSNDVIGSLAKSILQIDTNKKALASAAISIGKGYYDTPVQPRSSEDLLGNAIVEMKNDLQNYSTMMESLVVQRTEELRRTNEELQQFAHVASHDLKEPLRKIKTFTDMLIEEIGNEINEKSKKYVDKIHDAASRMSVMIDGVLKYSVITDVSEAVETVDLNYTIKGIISDLEIIITQKGAIISTENLPSVTGIPVLMHQLFYNLLNNALKFSREDGQPVISVTAKKPDERELQKIVNADSVSDFVEIIIADNGIGFNPAYAEEMFAVFSRLHPRAKYEGTGLGLALCKKIVQKHNGLIYATGMEGKGATFHVILPRATDKPE